ncbi:trimeric intracellular cation channel family protein [Paraferrimonas haliotis]|uniref:Membrane protein n=1 Tax=Paraferrimonas haliotis TaxID=2013866 RepID=A0AA37TQ35_9GAMM|nr:trimeric intracellular cation channel family protein [Paraferrimonas haliotis]GLS82486.1 membrane protein [Paraferrimonas haliotis]
MDWTLAEFVYLFDLIGVAVFALTGALAAGRHRMDHFGVLVLAAVTAIGGGTIRDVILGAPVFWLTDSNYLIAIVCTVILTLILARSPPNLPRWILPVADACGLALFTVIGADKALSMGMSGESAVIMGVITGVGGGLVRDLLCQRVPMILQKEIYASASIVGGVSFTLLMHLQWPSTVALCIAMLSALSLRLAAIKWQLSLPAFDLTSKLK